MATTIPTPDIMARTCVSFRVGSWDTELGFLTELLGVRPTVFLVKGRRYLARRSRKKRVQSRHVWAYSLYDNEPSSVRLEEYIRTMTAFLRRRAPIIRELYERPDLDVTLWVHATVEEDVHRLVLRSDLWRALLRYCPEVDLWIDLKDPN